MQESNQARIDLGNVWIIKGISWNLGEY